MRNVLGRLLEFFNFQKFLNPFHTLFIPSENIRNHRYVKGIFLPKIG